jgi:sugar fermentation stimulation protein A
MPIRVKVGENLRHARFISRLTRFTVLVEHDGDRFQCYLPNPGRLKELLLPGREFLLRPAQGPRRKTGFDVVGVKVGGQTVTVDSRLPNLIIREAFLSGELPEFSGYRCLGVEPEFGHSRLDFLLQGDELCLVEVKGCTLVRNGIALFPDAPTKRGRRHLLELLKARQEGYRACLVFVIQRAAKRFMPHQEIDPMFSTTLREVHAQGVEAIAYATGYLDGWVEVRGRVPVEV